MGLCFIAAVPVIVLVFFAVCCLKANWTAIDRENGRYYKDGYHIYYDRKILREIHKSDNNDKKKEL